MSISFMIDTLEVNTTSYDRYIFSTGVKGVNSKQGKKSQIMAGDRRNIEFCLDQKTSPCFIHFHDDRYRMLHQHLPNGEEGFLKCLKFKGVRSTIRACDSGCII
ncbi:hypothetical protein TNCV_791721 [Trichonephila clavipes]|nr:hypothetical protein TNCV_791721 [Trichonephila clavipes]